MGKIIMRNWNFREFHVRVDVPSPIWQVRVPIRGVITLTPGLPNPLSLVIPLISHICSHPQHRPHHYPPSLSFSSTTLLSSLNTKLGHPSRSLHALIMSWHRVQHTPSAASTHHGLSYLHSHDFKLTPECSFHFRHISLHNWPPSASSL